MIICLHVNLIGGLYMPEKKSSSTIGVRLSSSVIDQLDELCKVSASRAV